MGLNSRRWRRAEQCGRMRVALLRLLLRIASHRLEEVRFKGRDTSNLRNDFFQRIDVEIASAETRSEHPEFQGAPEFLRPFFSKFSL